MNMYHKLDNFQQLDIIHPKTKSFTYLNYKKKETYTELKKSLSLLTIDKVIFWSIILDMSYDYKEIVDFISLYICNDINIGNPRLSIFAWNLCEKIRDLDNKFPTFNYQEFRNHLNMLVSISCFSNKNQLPKLPVFKKSENINIHQFKHLIKREHFKHIDDIISINDNKIIFIPLNEIDYALSNSNDKNKLLIHCLHWLSYLLEIEKRSDDPLCKSRNIKGVNDKYNNNIVWLIWKIIFKNIDKKENSVKLFPIIDALFNLHMNNYTKNNSNKKKVYLVYSILLIINKTPTINYDLPYVVCPNEIYKLNMRINIVYQKIYNLGKKMDDNKDKVENKEEKKKKNNENDKQKIFVPILSD